MKKYWVSYGRTESGDDLPVLLWNRKPRNKEVDDAYRERCPEEFGEDSVGFVCSQVERVEVMFG